MLPNLSSIKSQWNVYEMMMMMMENIHISTDIRRGACFALYQIPLFLSHRYSCMLTPINDDHDGDGGDLVNASICPMPLKLCLGKTMPGFKIMTMVDVIAMDHHRHSALVTWIWVDWQRQPRLHVHLIQPVRVSPIVQITSTFLQHLFIISQNSTLNLKLEQQHLQSLFSNTTWSREFANCWFSTCVLLRAQDWPWF